MVFTIDNSEPATEKKPNLDNFNSGDWEVATEKATKLNDFNSGDWQPVEIQSQSILNKGQTVNTEVTDGTKVDFMTQTQVNKVPREKFFGMQDTGDDFDDKFIQDFVGKESKFLDLPRGFADETVGFAQSIMRFGTKISARSIVATQIGIRKIKGEDVTGEMTEWNKLISQELVKLSKTNEKYRQGLGIAKTKEDKLSFDLGGLVSQLGRSYFLKSPALVTASFAASQQQQLSEEIFQSTGDTGRAELVSTAIAIPTAAIEAIGINKFSKALKGNGVIRGIIGAAITESVQEGLQGVVEEIGTQAFGGREKELKDTIKDIVYGMLLGFIGGSSVASVSGIASTAMQKKGVNKKTADAVSEPLAEKMNENKALHKETAAIISRQNDNTTNYGNNVENGIAEVRKAVEDKGIKIEEQEDSRSPIEVLIDEARGDNFDLGEQELIDILETYDQAERELKKTHPKSLVQFIKENGGIFDEGGDLKSRDIAIATPFVLRKSPVNAQGEDVTPDAVALRAWEAGYFPEFDTRPDINDLLNAIDDDLRGNRRVSGQDIDAELERAEFARVTDQIDATLDVEKIRTIRDIRAGKIKLPEPIALKKEQGKTTQQISKEQPSTLTQDEALQQIAESEIEEQREIERKARLAENIQKELKETVLEKGVIAKGRYDYTTNKVFDEIRRVNKLTQETATNEIADFTDDTAELSEAENILRRFTLLKAKGLNNSSDALKTQILEDIKTLKNAGKKARDQKDFEDLVEKNKNVEETFELINKSKADSDKKRTKALNALLSGSGNFESYLNVLGGKKLADKFSVLENQKEEFNAVKRATDKIIDDISLITDSKKNKTLNSITDMGVKNFDLIASDTEGKPTKISTFDVIDIYNAIKNENIREDYYRVYGKDQIESIVSNLSDEQVKIADSLNDTVQSYYDKINKVFIKLYNRDLPFTKNYWMSSAENQSVTEIFNSYQVQSKNPSFVKRRERTRTPIPKNAFNKTMAFIQKAEYFDNLGLKYREIERTIKDTKVKKVITDKRGEKFYNSFIRQLDHFSLNSLNEDMTVIEEVENKLLGNWVVAKIGLNPTVAIKQLSSVVNYAENMPTAKWVSGFIKGLVSPKETFDFVWNNSEYLRNRYNNGYSEALQSAMNSANNMPKAKGALDKFKNFNTSFTRMGDIAAIVYGGKPYIDYLQKQGLSLKEAINEFENTTLRSQQSPFSSTRSALQNKKSPFVRTLLAFSNTPNQYARKFVESKAQYARGEISLAELGKTYTIYGIVNPAMYIWLGQALGSLIYGRGVDEEKATKEMLIMMAESPIAGIPGISDFADAALRGALGLKVYQNETPGIGDFIKLGEDLGTGEWIEAIKTFGELSTGAPIKTAEKVVKATAKRIN